MIAYSLDNQLQQGTIRDRKGKGKKGSKNEMAPLLCICIKQYKYMTVVETVAFSKTLKHPMHSST
jgi:hypothetical protein